MITLDLGFHRKANVWLEEMPDVEYQGSEIVEYVLETNISGLTLAKQVAVELTIPTGARIMYGMLGASYTPTSLRQLVVQISHIPKNVEEVEQIPGNYSQAVRLRGLPFEYVDSVVDGVHIAKNVLSGGFLEFNYAMHDPVGSNKKLFRQLSVVIIQIIASDVMIKGNLIGLIKNNIE